MRNLFIIAALPALLGTQPALAQAVPQSFQACASCHTTSADGANGMGPNLRGVVGRKAGGSKGFTYSNAMKQSKINWSDADLDAFIATPRTKVPGTSMAYFGLKDAAKRAQIIAYLKGLRR